ncbi:unnamed protein product, partial [Iphiclides podalirius]
MLLYNVIMFVQICFVPCNNGTTSRSHLWNLNNLVPNGMDEGLLNDLLECSVCLERLDTSSRVLPCQHTFCLKCLKVSDQ